MYAFIQDVPIKEDVWDKIKARLGEPVEGQIAHVVLRNADGTLRYVSVWTSKEACEAGFQKRIHPAVFSVFKEIGFRPAGEPKREEVSVVDCWLGRG